MRITTGAGVRAQIYDRNPTAIFKAFTGAIAAGTGLTIPWTYTVPSGRKALVTLAQAYALQVVAGTVPVEKPCEVILLGSSTNVIAAQANFFTNSIGVISSQVSAPQALLAAAQSVTTIYSNGDATGSFSLYLNGAATEFDA